ncbi:PHP domain-containing protein [Lachnotalea glycerini]|uniref:PHP domain-containing protein n=1 Tax=Lachnotalea glycerini TaxID=1763509 RepID=A0A371JJ64_9FIRM|nr:PHP domain-containing protein [Lachnotalea glycerini]RDY32769.1 PHP domain-containing protein [Lachnotalea glycerini]
MLKADMHTHTLRSDSSNSAVDTIQSALRNGIDILSFVDHDTIPNIAREMQLSKEYKITIISGIECEWMDYETGNAAHILGYRIKDYSYIKKLCDSVIEQRNENTINQIKILQKSGYDISVEEVTQSTEEPCLYTQNILYVLWKKGMIRELFGEFNQKIFKKGGIAYKTIEYPKTEQIVEAIVKGGGFAVLAHPGQQNNFYLIEDLVKAGLSGIELIHPSNNVKHRELVKKYADKYHLFMTGGSDCHGILSKSGGNIGDYYIEVNQVEDLFTIS